MKALLEYFQRIEAWLIDTFERLVDAVKAGYYSFRIRRVIAYLHTEGEFIGTACPHEVRIPMEAVRLLTDVEKSMLENALLLGARPYGATLHVCLRCYCLTRTTHKQTKLGPAQSWRDEVFVAPLRATKK